MAAATEKRNTCASCGQNVPKYKCPACLTHTCSLECVRVHKRVKHCSGVRDKTAFVSMKKYNDLNLFNDYSLLEGIGRKADSASRDVLQKKKNSVYRVNLLANQCTRRGIKLRVLPYPMSKRKNNRSFYLKKFQVIHWHVEWIFPQIEAKITDKVPGNETLAKALEKFLHPTESDPVRRHLLRQYVKLGIDRLSLVMKVEEHASNDPRFFKLDHLKGFDDNLAGKVVVEYPTIFVLMPEEFSQYKLFGEANGEQAAEEMDSSTDSSTSSSSEDSDSSSHGEEQSDTSDRSEDDNASCKATPDSKESVTENVDMNQFQIPASDGVQQDLNENSTTQEIKTELCVSPTAMNHGQTDTTFANTSETESQAPTTTSETTTLDSICTLDKQTTDN